LRVKVGKTSIVLAKGDITDQDVDAVVNAANPSLMGGGGVDGAIHRKGGPQIDEECSEIRRSQYPDGLPPGKAVITHGGKLKARYVIHTVGPVWKGGKNGEAELLAAAYRNSLALAAQKGLNSIAFPAISTGAYGYPFEDACRVVLQAIVQELNELGGSAPEEVRLVMFTEGDFNRCAALMRSFFPGLAKTLDRNRWLKVGARGSRLASPLCCRL